jgi:multicomponent Na+:H+ antiporter subunit G
VIELTSSFYLAVGVLFWFLGTRTLLKVRPVLVHLHYLSIADTLGSLSIVFGLLFLRPKEWPLLVLAMISLALWNTLLGYVIAYGMTDDRYQLSDIRYQVSDEGGQRIDD